MARKIVIPAERGPVDSDTDAKSVTVTVDDIKTGAKIAKRIFGKIFKKKQEDDE